MPMTSRMGMLVSGFAAAALAAGDASAAAFAESDWGGSPLFFKSGINGFAAPSNGAAVPIVEGGGGVGPLQTSISGGSKPGGNEPAGMKGDSSAAPQTFGGLTGRFRRSGTYPRPPVETATTSPLIPGTRFWDRVTRILRRHAPRHDSDSSGGRCSPVCGVPGS